MGIVIVTGLRKSIVAIGDSLTYNGRYELTLNGLLADQWTVTNKGAMGNKTSDMLSRFNADVISNSPGYVIIWGGINDCVSEIPATTIENNLAAMYLSAKNNLIKVIAVNISPAKGLATWTEQDQGILDSVNAWLSEMPSNIDWMIDVFSALEDPENPDQLLPAYDSGDHVHLSNAGYDAIATAIFNEVFQ